VWGSMGLSRAALALHLWGADRVPAGASEAPRGPTRGMEKAGRSVSLLQHLSTSKQIVNDQLISNCW
jgi:hypothetical protein